MPLKNLIPPTSEDRSVINNIEAWVIALGIMIFLLSQSALFYLWYLHDAKIKKIESEYGNTLKDHYQAVVSMFELINKIDTQLKQDQNISTETQGEIDKIKKNLEDVLNQPTPTPHTQLGLSSAEPNNLPKNFNQLQKSDIILKGQGFDRTTRISVISADGGLPNSSHVEYLSENELKITLPDNLSPGYYDFLVTNSDNSQFLAKSLLLITNQEQ